jgi:hypothetical protein
LPNVASPSTPADEVSMVADLPFLFVLTLVEDPFVLTLVEDPSASVAEL